MQDVSMRRMLASLVIAAAVGLLVVSGALLFGMGKPAQAQSNPEPPCTTFFCLDKTATPNPATVGEPITFTITERCPGGGPAGCTDIQTLVDQVPPELTVDSVAPARNFAARPETPLRAGTQCFLPNPAFYANHRGDPDGVWYVH